MSDEPTFEQAARSLTDYLNNELPRAVLEVCRVAGDAPWAESARVEGIDPAGVTVAMIDENDLIDMVHIPFSRPAADAGDMRQLLMELVDRADRPDGIRREAWARVPTPNATRYLRALCNHFDRKAEATYDDNAGRVRFPFGECELRAETDALTLRVAAESEVRFARTRHVVADHLERFAQKEGVRVRWITVERLGDWENER